MGARDDSGWQATGAAARIEVTRLRSSRRAPPIAGGRDAGRSRTAATPSGRRRPSPGEEAVYLASMMLRKSRRAVRHSGSHKRCLPQASFRLRVETELIAGAATSQRPMVTTIDVT